MAQVEACTGNFVGSTIPKIKRFMGLMSPLLFLVG